MNGLDRSKIRERAKAFPGGSSWAAWIDLLSADVLALDKALTEAEAEEARLSEAQMLLNAAEAALAVSQRERDTAVDITKAAIGRCDAAEARSAELEDALQRLVYLKDGPRDDEYHLSKVDAWAAARAALAPAPAEETT